MRPVICQGCREKFVRKEGNFVKDSKGFYHKACHEEMLQERSQRQDLLKFVVDAIGDEVNLAFVQKQVRTYTEQYKYTVSGIKGTIHYFIHVRGVKAKPQFGIAFVPYNYNKAREYFEKMEDMKKIETFEELDVRQVTISEPKQEKIRKTVSLEDLFSEED